MKRTQKNTDDIIWNIFEKDKIEQGFELKKETISLKLQELKRARARGGFLIGQLVHQAIIREWQALTFDDITGAPYRALASRQEADLTTEIAPGLKLKIPLVSSNMECVTGYDMAIGMASIGGIGILHQFVSPEEQAATVKKVKKTKVEKLDIEGRVYEPAVDSKKRYLVGAAIGVRNGNIERAKLLVEAEADILVVDIAHGHSDQMIETVKKLKELYPKIPIVAGNVVSPKGAYELCKAGVDVLKVGVGSGAACTTRLVTGYGIPQITAIYETALIAKKFNVRIMADGGIKNSGEMVKALAAGADTIMIGRLLAATDKSNIFNERIVEMDENKKPKTIKYYGSASEISKKKQGRGSFDAPEGRCTYLSYAGETLVLLAKLITGIQSGISYAGNSRDPNKNEHANIQRLRNKSRWIRQTSSGIYEGNKGSYNTE
jgi:IMP dehydrogenase